MELGPKDLEAQAVVLVRRDTGADETVAWANVAQRVPELLEEIQVRRRQPFLWDTAATGCLHTLRKQLRVNWWPLWPNGRPN